MITISIPLGIVNCFVVLGNLLVFYVILTRKSLQSSTNTLVLSLTISDLLLGILILPFAIIQEYSSEWLFGQLGCRIWLSLDVFLSTASIYNLLAISFDRYMAVKQPIKYTIISSAKVIRLMLLLVWMCSLLLAIVLFVLTASDRVESECQPTTLPSMYIIFSACASFIVPAFLMIILNACIFKKVLATSRTKTVKSMNGSLRVHRKEKNALTVAKIEKADTRTSLDDDRDDAIMIVEKDNATIRTFLSQTVVFGVLEAKKTNIINHIAQKRMARRSLRTEMRVARTTGIVVSAFVVCWIPFTTIYVLQAYDVCTVAAGCISNSLYLIAFWLGYSNSAINPILYAAFSRDFRIALKRVLFKRQKY